MQKYVEWAHSKYKSMYKETNVMYMTKFV